MEQAWEEGGLLGYEVMALVIMHTYVTSGVQFTLRAPWSNSGAT